MTQSEFDSSAPPDVAPAMDFEVAQRAVFEDIASRYDTRFMRSRWPRNVEARVRLIERVLGSVLSRRILEIGCGTGQMGESLLDRNPSLRYVGVDLSEGMLDIARIRTDRFQQRVELRQVVGQLPLEPLSCDGGFGVDVLHHIERPIEILTQLREALVPGGSIVFLEANPRFPVTAALGVFQRHERGVLGISRKSLAKWASEAGFVDVKTAWGPVYTPPAPSALIPALDRVDNLCAAVPGLRSLALHVVLQGRRPLE